MNTETRICAYCKSEFQVKPTSRKKYCKRTCSVYASQERNGRREPRNKIVPMLPMDSLQQQIREQQNKVDNSLSRYDEVVQKLNDIHNSNTFGEKRGVEKQLQKLNGKEELSVDDHREIKRLESQQIVIEKKWQEEIKDENELPLLIQQMYFKYEKDLVKLNLLKQNHLKVENDNLVTSDNIGSVLSTVPVYHFDYFAKHENFSNWDTDTLSFPVRTIIPLGHPKNPFTALFYGEYIYTIENIIMYIAASLRECYNTKVLFLLDGEQDKIDFLKRLKEKEKWLTTIHPDIAVKVVQSRGEIEDALKQFPCEFLFINDAQKLRLDKQFIKKLQRNLFAPSVFCLSENDMVQLRQYAEIIYKCDDERNGFLKRKCASTHFDYWDFHFE